MLRNVVLVCPCCASRVDAITRSQPQQLECVSCGQVWTMIVDSARLAEYSLT